MTGIIIKTEKLCKTFSSGGIQQHVLKNLDISLVEGDFTIIMGSSGSGKSTLLYAMSGMDKPTLGEINFAGKKISQLNNDQLAIFRRNHCGFVFQQIYLLDNMSVLDNVLASGLLVYKNKREIAQKAKELLIQVGIDENAWSKFPTQLSGGEAQRTKLAYELGKPSRGGALFMLDEPTTGLHFVDIEKLITVLHNLVDQGNTLVVIEHNLEIIKEADYVIDLGPEGGDRGGEIVAQGSPEQIIQNGKRSHTARFLREYLRGNRAGC